MADTADSSPIRVLIVEDEEDCRTTMDMLLTMNGYEVRVAGTGQEALAVGGEFLPDVVFLDLGLPAMDGFETAAALRANPRTRNARIVAVTGYSAERERERAAAAGIEFFLVKPAMLGDLLAVAQV